MAKEPLGVRLYFQAHLHELAQLVSYGGIRSSALKEKLPGLEAAHGARKVAEALSELTVTDEKAGVVSLTPQARKACWQLLGPPPEHPGYARYYEVNGRTPPENHQPPRPPAPSAKRRKGGRP
jgi:hypothetical protein